MGRLRIAAAGLCTASKSSTACTGELPSRRVGWPQASRTGSQGEAGRREVIQALWPLNQHNLTSGIDAVAVDASAAIDK